MQPDSNSRLALEAACGDPPTESLRDRPSSVVPRIVLFCCGALVLGSVAGIGWGGLYLRQQAIADLSEDLSESLQRPVHLGKIQSISPMAIRVGQSVIPPTATDPDTVTIEAVEIGYYLPDLLFKGKLGLNVTLINPQLFLAQNQAGDWLDTALVLESGDQLEVRHFQVKNGTVRLLPNQKTRATSAFAKSGEKTALVFRGVNANLSLPEDSQPAQFDAIAQFTAGGSLKMQGTIDSHQDQIAAEIQTQRLAIAPLSVFMPPDLQIDRGQVSSQLQVQIEGERSPQIIGNAQIQDMALRLEGEPNPFTQARVDLQIANEQILLENGSVYYGQIPFQNVHGKFDGEQGLDLDAQVKWVSLAAFAKTFNLDLPFTVKGALRSDDLHVTTPNGNLRFAGTVYNPEPLQIDRVPIPSVRTEFSLDKFDDQPKDRLILKNLTLNPTGGGQALAEAQIMLGDEDEGEEDEIAMKVAFNQISADAIAQLYKIDPENLQIGKLNGSAQLAVLHDQLQVAGGWRLSEGSYPAEGKIAVKNDQLQLEDVQIQAAGGTVHADGTLADGQWQAALKGEGIPLSAFAPQVPGVVKGALQLKGRTDDFSLEAIAATGKALIQVANGTVEVTGDARQGRWQARVQGSQLQLDRLTPKLPGQLDGSLHLAGNLNQLRPEQIQAEGEVQLSKGVFAALRSPLTTSLRWDRNRLYIQRATASGIELDGWVNAKPNGGALPAIANWDLNLKLFDYDLATLPFNLANAAPVTGKIDFDGKVTGTPDLPQVQGNVQLQNLTVEQLAFEPQMQGEIGWIAKRGMTLALRGTRDRLAAALDANFKPTTFNLKLDRAQVVGRFHGSRLRAHLQRLPLEKISGLLGRSLNLGQLGGELSGRVDVDLADAGNPKAIADIVINDPTFNSTQPRQVFKRVGDRFKARLTYADGIASLADGELLVGNSRFLMAGSYTTGKKPHLSGQLEIEQGYLRDVASTLKNLNLLEQKELPQALLELDGTFSAKAILSGPSLTAASVRFGIEGQDWRWRDYTIQKIRLAEGAFDGTTLNLPALELAGLVVTLPPSAIPPSPSQTTALDPSQTERLSDRPYSRRQHFDDLSLTFAGQLNVQQPYGKVQVKNMPVPLLLKWANSTLPLSGRINANAELSGSLFSPAVQGEIDPFDVWILNIIQFSSNKIGFRYTDEQLDWWR